MTPTNNALAVEDVLAASGGMQELNDVLSTVVQDALQEREAWCGPMGTLRRADRGAQRLTVPGTEVRITLRP